MNKHVRDLHDALPPASSSAPIRLATDADWPGIWAILEPVIREGETYPLDRDLPENEARAYWWAPDKTVYVADCPTEGIVGSYYLRPNLTGPAAHVANAGYVVHPEHRRRGVATALCNHSLDEARTKGFRAMQYSLVVSTNIRAVRLWQYLRFTLVGTLPGAFRHPTLGYVDAYVMYRSLVNGS